MTVFQRFQLQHIFLLQHKQQSILVYGVVKDAEEINNNFFEGQASVTSKRSSLPMHLLSHVSGIVAEIKDSIRESTPNSSLESSEQPVDANAHLASEPLCLVIGNSLGNTPTKLNFLTSLNSQLRLLALHSDLENFLKTNEKVSSQFDSEALNTHLKTTANAWSAESQLDSKNLGKNSIKIALGLIITMGLSLVPRVFLPRTFGPDLMGILYFSESFGTMFFSFLSLGLAFYISKEQPARIS